MLRWKARLCSGGKQRRDRRRAPPACSACLLYARQRIARSGDVAHHLACCADQDKDRQIRQRPSELGEKLPFVEEVPYNPEQEQGQQTEGQDAHGPTPGYLLSRESYASVIARIEEALMRE